MLNYKWLILLLSSLFTFGQASTDVRTFSPPSFESVSLESQAQFFHSQDRMHLKSSIKKSILQAKESILIFTFSLSDPEVIESLNQKSLEGIQVTVVIDKDHLADIKNKGHSNIEILTRSSGEGHLHHKMLIVDRREVWIGSANFTTSAYKTQENLMVRFASGALAAYLHKEANVFRGLGTRSEHGPLPIVLHNQTVYFCLLPHDGFPPKKIEKSINDHSKKFLIEKINQANHSIKIAMMVWTNHDLTQAVIQAHQRGVEVQVVAPDFEGSIPKMMAEGIDVKVNPNLSFMHNKFAWIDEQMLVNGSTNWSQSSFTRSDESFIVLEPMTADQSEELWLYWNYLFPQP